MADRQDGKLIGGKIHRDRLAESKEKHDSGQWINRVVALSTGGHQEMR